MEVYHNELKQLQFVKEYRWSYLYEAVLSDVVKHAVAMYMIEMLQHSLKQPEANPELFYLIEDSLKQLDKGNETLTANLPLYFIMHLATELGFKPQGNYSSLTPVFDLQEGMFVAHTPAHPYYLEGLQAEITSQLNELPFYNELEHIKLNRTIRRSLLESYQTFMSLHITDFGELKTLAILQEILS
jgi:DNA repair protein RecO (recombination protein O)